MKPESYISFVNMKLNWDLEFGVRRLSRGFEGKLCHFDDVGPN
jgi:hypothetical protein